MKEICNRKNYKNQIIWNLKKIEILMEEILKAVKRIDNKLEKIEEKINKLENRMINIEIQQKYSY